MLRALIHFSFQKKDQNHSIISVEYCIQSAFTKTYRMLLNNEIVEYNLIIPDVVSSNDVNIYRWHSAKLQ